MVFAATPPYDGTLSKYYVTESDFCYPLPRNMDLEHGAMVEPVAVGVQVTKVGDVRANQNVVVFGCGPIGLLSQAVSRAYAAKKVIGIDTSQARLDFAKSFCADDVFKSPPKPENVADPAEWSATMAKMITDKFHLGDGPDVVLECTGVQACIQTGIYLTRRGGAYVQAGMGKDVGLYLLLSTSCMLTCSCRMWPSPSPRRVSAT